MSGSRKDEGKGKAVVKAEGNEEGRKAGAIDICLSARYTYYSMVFFCHDVFRT